jgi:hypothetical protein
MRLGGRRVLSVALLGAMLAGCSTTNEAPERQISAKPTDPTAIEPAVAAFRDICFAYRPPYTQARAAAARYGVKRFETKQGSSLISGKYTYVEGASDDGSLIVVINPDGLCDTKYRRHPGMADDETIERQFANVIRTKYPDAFKIGDRGREYHVSINGKRTSFAFSLNHDGYIHFMSP